MSAIFGTNLSNITKVTSQEVILHIPYEPYCLTQHVEISFPHPPIERSSDLFWLWTNTSYLLDLHATSHDAAPPRNLKLTLSATAAKGSSCTLDFQPSWTLFSKLQLYIYIYKQLLMSLSGQQMCHHVRRICKIPSPNLTT